MAVAFLGRTVLPLVLLAVALLAPSVWALPIATASAQLGGDGNFSYAVAEGTMVYVFRHNADWSQTQIDAYDTVTDTLSAWVATIPERTAAPVHTEAGIFVFGCCGPTTTTYRFDASTLAVSTMTSQGPEIGAHASSFSDGQYAYIVGGCSAPCSVLRYDPTSDAWTTLGYGLGGSQVREGAAVWTGSRAYYASPQDQSRGLGHIHEIDPANGTVTLRTEVFPLKVQWVSAVWCNRLILYGGLEPGQGPTDAIQVFRPGSVTVSADTLPSAASATGAVRVGNESYVFGGGPDHRRIYHHDAGDCLPHTSNGTKGNVTASTTTSAPPLTTNAPTSSKASVGPAAEPKTGTTSQAAAVDAAATKGSPGSLMVVALGLAVALVAARRRL